MERIRCFCALVSLSEPCVAEWRRFWCDAVQMDGKEQLGGGGTGSEIPHTNTHNGGCRLVWGGASAFCCLFGAGNVVEFCSARAWGKGAKK
jgi:hypothetical protein